MFSHRAAGVVSGNSPHSRQTSSAWRTGTRPAEKVALSSPCLHERRRTVNSFGPFLAGNGRHRVEVFCRTAGPDLFVSVSGGERPHVGAVSLAVPAAQGGADNVGLLCAPGHRDDLPAHALAKKLCAALGRTVCLTVGLHVDHAEEKDIALLVKNAEEAVTALTSALKSEFSATNRE